MPLLVAVGQWDPTSRVLEWSDCSPIGFMVSFHSYAGDLTLFGRNDIGDAPIMGCFLMAFDIAQQHVDDTNLSQIRLRIGT